MKLHVAWYQPQPTIRYFHLTWFTKSFYQKAEKKIVKRKKKKTERKVDSRYVEGVIDVEWERNGERDREKSSGKKKKKKKLSFFINIYYIWTIKNLRTFPIWDLKLLLKRLKGWAGLRLRLVNNSTNLKASQWFCCH